MVHCSAFVHLAVFNLNKRFGSVLDPWTPIRAGLLLETFEGSISISGSPIFQYLAVGMWSMCSDGML